jgi:Alcohol dehydrogenase GroES-like domain
LPKPQPAKDRVLVHVTAAGVTPLDHTILSGGHPRAKAPLVLGNEGAGVIEDAGDSGLAVGNRVMFTGPYGVGENGAWQEWLLARPQDRAAGTRCARTPACSTAGRPVALSAGAQPRRCAVQVAKRGGCAGHVHGSHSTPAAHAESSR